MADIIWNDRKHWTWFPISFTKYKLSETRFFKEIGLFNTTYDETQLYRIVDVQLRRSFGHKIFGTGNISLQTRDRNSPEIIIQNVKNPESVKEMLVSLVEENRRKNFVRDINVGDGFGDMGNFEDLDGNGIPDQFE